MGLKLRACNSSSLNYSFKFLLHFKIYYFAFILDLEDFVFISGVPPFLLSVIPYTLLFTYSFLTKEEGIVVSENMKLDRKVYPEVRLLVIILSFILEI